MRLIENFDNWNRLYESKMTSKVVRSINEADDPFEKLMASIKSGIAYSKAMGMLDKYKEADRAQKQDIIDLAVANKQKKIEKALEDLANKEATAKGKQRELIVNQKQKLKDQKAAIKDQVVVIKQKADNELAALKEKLDKLEKEMTGKLAELFASQKSKAGREVAQEAAEAKAKVAEMTGKAERAAQAKADLAEIQKEIQAIEDKIIQGEDASKDNLEQIEGLKTFMPEITALSDARDARKKVQKDIDKLSIGMSESLVSEDLSSAVTAVGDDEGKLTKLKGLFDKLKQAKEAEHAAKETLYNKVKGSGGVTTKAAITLAGGDPKKATEKDGKWEIGPLIKKWGGDAGFIKADEYVKDVTDAIQKVEDKEAGAGESDPPANDNGGELTDDQKAEIRQKIQKLEDKIASGETKKEGKPEDIKQKIEQSLAAKRTELENLKAQLGESFGSYEKTMAILTEMESSIDAILREYNKVENTSSHYVSESIAARFKKAMDQRGPRF
jgi:DNA repair exonuclease SbcCD ATPase subunit